MMIPKRNVRNLMLRKDVVEQVRKGKFHIWGISTIEEGLRVLTAMEPGEPAEDGTYPKGTIFRLVDEKLSRLAEDVRRFGFADSLPPG